MSCARARATAQSVASRASGPTPAPARSLLCSSKSVDSIEERSASAGGADRGGGGGGGRGLLSRRRVAHALAGPRRRRGGRLGVGVGGWGWLGGGFGRRV